MHTAVKPWMTVVFAMLLLAGLTMPFMGRNGLWFDELFAVQAASSLQHLGSVLSTYENNMALYFFCLSAWMTFGDSEFTVRLLSVLFALAAIPLMYRLVLRLFGPREAAIACVLLAINALMVHHAQEARSYAMLVLLSILGSLLFVEALRQPRIGLWIGYAVCMAAAVYAHYFGALVVIAHAVALLFPGRPVVPWRLALPSAALLFVLLLPLLLFRPTTPGQVDWIERPNFGSLVNLGTQFSGGRSALLGYAFGIAICLFFFIRRRTTDSAESRWAVYFVVMWLVVPVAIALAVSLTFKPVFVTKYLIEALPAFIILVAVGLARLPTWGVAIALVGFLSMLINRYTKGDIGPTEPWREVATYVVQRAKPGHGVICYPFFLTLPFSFYARRVGDGQVDLTPIPIASAPFHPGGGAIDPAPDFEAISRAATSHPRLWLIMSSEGGARMNRDFRPAIEQRIEVLKRKQSMESFPSPQFYDQFDITLYDQAEATITP